MKKIIVALAVSYGALAVPFGLPAQAAAFSSFTQTEVLSGQANGRAVYVYEDGAAYDVWCKPGFVTAINLHQGEEILFVGGGDTARWIIDTAQAAKDGKLHEQILVKPLQTGISTNVIINTNQRSYQLNLLSSADQRNSAVEWVYGGSQRLTFGQFKQTEKLNAQAPEKLNFRYRMKGKAPFKPVQAFDDGKKTFFLMPANVGEAPVLYAKRDGKLSLINYRKKGSYYIVDQLLQEAELRAGKTVIKIYNESKDEVS